MTVSHAESLIVLGRRIQSPGHAACPGGRVGTVVEVDGGAFRVVWEDGSHGWRVAGQLNGPQALVALPPIVEPELIAGLIAKADQVQREKADTAQTKAREKDVARAALAAAHPHLSLAPFSRCPKTAAKNIRVELKAAGIKATVRLSRFSMGNSVTVSVTDADKYEAAESIADKYAGSQFNGMDDSSTTICTDWTECFGSSRFINVVIERERS